jgi:hypothetical protein
VLWQALFAWAFNPATRDTDPPEKVGCVGLAVDAVGVDLEQDRDAVPGPAGDLGRPTAPAQSRSRSPLGRVRLGLLQHEAASSWNRATPSAPSASRRWASVFPASSCTTTSWCPSVQSSPMYSNPRPFRVLRRFRQHQGEPPAP